MTCAPDCHSPPALDKIPLFVGFSLFSLFASTNRQQGPDRRSSTPETIASMPQVPFRRPWERESEITDETWGWNCFCFVVLWNLNLKFVFFFWSPELMHMSSMPQVRWYAGSWEGRWAGGQYPGFEGGVSVEHHWGVSKWDTVRALVFSSEEEGRDVRERACLPTPAYAIEWFVLKHDSVCS